ncbi:MAG: hypothetical protein FJZ59_02975 [Chlamydiae bacterium]|nr:hypothetical protein [Chlamydiota bacterium]
MLRSHSRVSRKNGAIGSSGPYSIFATADQGLSALSDWLSLKSWHRSKVKAVAKYYQSNNSKKFIE